MFNYARPRTNSPFPHMREKNQKKFLAGNNNDGNLNFEATSIDSFSKQLEPSVGGLKRIQLIPMNKEDGDTPCG